MIVHWLFTVVLVATGGLIALALVYLAYRLVRHERP